MGQGTIKSYDERARSGWILDDAHNEIAFDFESFRDMGVRLFRIGQRVKWQSEGDKVRSLTLVTF